MRWHDAREVIPDEGEEVWIKGKIYLGPMVCEPAPKAWIKYGLYVWISQDESYWTVGDFRHWLYLDEIFEELEEND